MDIYLLFDVLPFIKLTTLGFAFLGSVDVDHLAFVRDAHFGCCSSCAGWMFALERPCEHIPVRPGSKTNINHNS